jgi:hypothetical protein
MIFARDNTGAEKEPLDHVAAIKVYRELRYFLGGEYGASDIVGDAVDAVGAVIEAVVGKKDFKQRYTPPIGRVGVTDSAVTHTAHSSKIKGANRA